VKFAKAEGGLLKIF